MLCAYDNYKETGKAETFQKIKHRLLPLSVSIISSTTKVLRKSTSEIDTLYKNITKFIPLKVK